MITNEQALERGTGRTTRLIKALPKGAAFLVHDRNLCRMVDSYKHEVGRSDITVAPMSHMLYAIRDKEAVGIDHCVIEAGYMLDLDFNERMALREIKNVYVLDEMNMPTCIPGAEVA